MHSPAPSSRLRLRQSPESRSQTLLQSSPHNPPSNGTNRHINSLYWRAAMSFTIWLCLFVFLLFEGRGGMNGTFNFITHQILFFCNCWFEYDFRYLDKLRLRSCQILSGVGYSLACMWLLPLRMMRECCEAGPGLWEAAAGVSPEWQFSQWFILYCLLESCQSSLNSRGTMMWSKF